MRDCQERRGGQPLFSWPGCRGSAPLGVQGAKPPLGVQGAKPPLGVQGAKPRSLPAATPTNRPTCSPRQPYSPFTSFIASVLSSVTKLMMQRSGLSSLSSSRVAGKNPSPHVVMKPQTA
jgi:hypothetical protein